MMVGGIDIPSELYQRFGFPKIHVISQVVSAIHHNVHYANALNTVELNIKGTSISALTRTPGTALVPQETLTSGDKGAVAPGVLEAGPLPKREPNDLRAEPSRTHRVTTSVEPVA